MGLQALDVNRYSVATLCVVRAWVYLSTTCTYMYVLVQTTHINSDCFMGRAGNEASSALTMQAPITLIL